MVGLWSGVWGFLMPIVVGCGDRHLHGRAARHRTAPQQIGTLQHQKLVLPPHRPLLMQPQWAAAEMAVVVAAVAGGARRGRRKQLNMEAQARKQYSQHIRRWRPPHQWTAYSSLRRRRDGAEKSPARRRGEIASSFPDEITTLSLSLCLSLFALFRSIGINEKKNQQIGPTEPTKKEARVSKNWTVVVGPTEPKKRANKAQPRWTQGCPYHSPANARISN